MSADLPLIIHVIHALGVGGLENGLVNLVNHMPADRYRHAIVCMTTSSDFSKRIRTEGVEIIAMHRGQVPLWRTYLQLFALFRRMRPAIVHTRNLSGLDALIPALCAGVAVRIQGEHGRDLDDAHGSNPKYRRLRRLFRPFINRYTTVSKDLQNYLIGQIGVGEARITQIYNGVDTERFYPRSPDYRIPYTLKVPGDGLLIVGTVGRLQPVKDQVTLVRAFAEACRAEPGIMKKARLIIVGDGPLRNEVETEVESSGVGDCIALLGERQDVPAVLRSFDLFVLPSRDEGISNTLLEAMATGVPVLATRVGGNPELIPEGEVGQLVEARDCSAMAAWIVRYASDPSYRVRQGAAARRHVVQRFSLDAMVNSYLSVYDELTGRYRHDGAASVKNSMTLP